MKLAQSTLAQSTHSVCASEAEQLLLPLWTAQLAGAKGIPTVELRGGPGVGKSALARALLAKAGATQVLVFAASQLAPTDFGMPVPHGEELHYRLLKFLRDLTVAGDAEARAKWESLKALGKTSGDYRGPGRTALIIEEVGLAQPAVQGMLLPLMFEGEIGATQERLLPGVVVVALSNNEEDSPHMSRLSGPLRNRMLRLVYRPIAEEWLAYAAEVGVLPEIRAFLRSSHQYLNLWDAKSDPEAFATPRMWTLFSVALRLWVECGIDLTLVEKAAHGMIGPEASIAFLSFYNSAIDVPSATEIAESPETVDSLHGRPDAAWCAVENILQSVNHHPERLTAYLQYAKRLDNLHRDFLLERLLRNADGNLSAEAVNAIIDHTETPEGAKLYLESLALPAMPGTVS